MKDLLIIIILIVILGVGIMNTIKHFKKKSGCCGSGDAPTKTVEKKLDNVIKTTTYTIDGMHCDHCKGWVEKAINAIDGASAKVDLYKKVAIVSFDREVEDKEVCNAIIKAGYKVIDIKHD